MKLKVGIVGLRRGLTYIRILKSLPNVSLVAVCDLKSNLARAIAEENKIEMWFDNYDIMLKRAKLDIVIICTPAPLHAIQSIKAMEIGVNVLSEVPAAYSLDECKALVRTVRKTKAKYMMAENCCYFPFAIFWEKIVGEGKIGEPIYAEAEYVHDCRFLMRDEQGRLTWRAKMPPIIYCTHSLGPLLKIMKDRCKLAIGMHTGCNVDPDIGAIDLEIGLFKTEKGRIIKVLTGFSIIREPPLLWYVIYGTKGCLETKRCNWDYYKAYFKTIPKTEGMIKITDEEVNTIIRNMYKSVIPSNVSHPPEYMLVNEFINCIINDTKPPIDVYRSLDYTLPGICAHISAKKDSKVVNVPDPKTF